MELQVFGAGQMQVERGRLHQRADAAQQGGAVLGQGEAEQSDVTAVRALQPEDHPDGGRLPGSVRPQERVHTLGRDG